MNKNYRVDNKNTIQTECFVNPYNFVPTSANSPCNKTVSRSMIYDGDLLSGSICVTLETLTPLFIPNTTTEAAFHFKGGKSYDFFSYENFEDLPKGVSLTEKYARPVIPGSSIRGAVRSAFEAVTNSCFSTCDDEDLVFHRRTTVPKQNYGILSKKANGYVITKAEKLMLNTSIYHGIGIATTPHTFGKPFNRTGNTINVNGVSKRTGDTVFALPTNKTFSPKIDLRGVDDLSDTAATNYDPGILFLGEKFPKKPPSKPSNRLKFKHHDAVFCPKPDEPGVNPFTIGDGDYDRFFKVWEQYQKDSPGSYPHYINMPEIPVYYNYVGAKIYITPACISKEVFDTEFSTLLGDYKPCCDSARGLICSACSLFGMVSEKSDGSLASRLMFRDALPKDFNAASARDFYEPPRVLPILGTPQISATEFYTEDSTDVYNVWNYDYGIRKSDEEREAFTPKLRGRKFYWHKSALTANDTAVRRAGDKDTSRLTAKVRAVKEGKRFQFEIAFDRLKKSELDALIWTLTFGDKHSTHAHKLGHGKPVGYGSVKYTVDKVTLFKLRDKDLAIVSEPYYPVDGSDAGFADSPPDEYLMMTNFADAPKNVSYPYGEGTRNSGVYQWFGLNKGNMTNPEFQQVLATPREIMEPETAPSARDTTTRTPARGPRGAVNAPARRETTPALNGATIGDMYKAIQAAPRPASPAHSYGVYKAADIKGWLAPHMLRVTTEKLRSFVADYEKAQEENDVRYRPLEHLYRKAKDTIGS